MNSTNDNFFVNPIDKANDFQAILNKIGMFPSGLGFVTDSIRNSLSETDNTSNTLY